jgi:hypothetical protein
MVPFLRLRVHEHLPHWHTSHPWGRKFLVDPLLPRASKLMMPFPALSRTRAPSASLAPAASLRKSFPPSGSVASLPRFYSLHALPCISRVSIGHPPAPNSPITKRDRWRLGMHRVVPLGCARLQHVCRRPKQTGGPLHGAMSMLSHRQDACVHMPLAACSNSSEPVGDACSQISLENGP